MAARALAAQANDHDQAVAMRLRGCLAEKRLTKHQLAEMLGQTDFWVGRRANGQTAITIGELISIADVLREPLTRFLPEDSARSLLATLAPAPSARSSTDRASDYGSEGWRFRPFPPGGPPRERRRRNSSHVVPLRLVADDQVPA